MSCLTRIGVLFAEVVLLGAMVLGHSPSRSAAGVEYYVSPSGNDSSPGTMAQPWRTLAKANRELQAGDTLYLRAGVYDEFIQPDHSGMPDSPISYARYQDEDVVIRGQPDVARLVSLHNQSYIIIDGLDLSYGHAPPKGDKRWAWVHIGEDAHHNVIRNCRLSRLGEPLALYQEGYQEFGIVLSGASHNLIEGNSIAGVNQGIHLKNTPQFNRILNNTITGTGQSSIVIGSSKGVMQGTLIEGNILERSAIEDGIQFMEDVSLPHGPRREADISNLGTVIRGNVIREHNENAIDLKSAAHVIIEDNLIYGNVGSSNGPRDGWNHNAHGSITRGSNTSTRDVIIRRNVIYDSAPGIRAHQGYKIYHNTLVANNRDYTGPNSVWTAEGRPAFSGIRQKEPGEGGIAIQNNIVVGHNTVEVALWPLDSQPEPSHIDGNLYYNSEGVFFGQVKPSREWEVLTLGMWQRLLRSYDTVTGNDRSSFVADPTFVDAPERPVGRHDLFDFHLADGSPAIDRGRPLTWTEGRGSGAQITVEDAGYFADGFGVVEGDSIQIGDSPVLRVMDVDYDRNLLTVDQHRIWRDGAPVSLAYHGSAPDIGAFECEGECTPAVPNPLPDERVSAGLQALYTFAHGGGGLVRDVSGVGAPLDLVIQEPGAVRWAEDSLALRGPTLIASSEAATKITTACQASGELTVEAWISPQGIEPGSPARIVTLSSGAGRSSFALTLESSADDPRAVFGILLEANSHHEDGVPLLSSLPGAARSLPTHVVFTQAASGLSRLYVNRELHASETAGGDLSGWDDAFSLLVGNEATTSYPWLGRLYLVAIYCRALDSTEIGRNYAVGLREIYRTPY
jgi:parallel beta-helix repeat protein